MVYGLVKSWSIKCSKKVDTRAVFLGKKVGDDEQ